MSITIEKTPRLDFVPVHVLADELGVSTATVRRWVRHGKLTAAKFGRERFIHVPSARQYLLDAREHHLKAA